MSVLEGGHAAALAAALEHLGLPCSVEPRERLAVLRAPERIARQLTDIETRRDMIALAKAHGFTHVAVELTEPVYPADAPLLRD